MEKLENYLAKWIQYVQKEYELQIFFFFEACRMTLTHLRSKGVKLKVSLPFTFRVGSKHFLKKKMFQNFLFQKKKTLCNMQ